MNFLEYNSLAISNSIIAMDEGQSFYGSNDVLLNGHCYESLDLLKNLLMKQSLHLMVVSDFDHTLTQMNSEQCHDIVGYNKIYSQEFMKEFNAIFEVPRPMDEWWRITHDCIVEKSGLTRDMFRERVGEGSISVRDGLKDFIQHLREEEIPLVVVSAGIRDVITETLANNEIPISYDHLFHIDANYLEFKPCGSIASINPLSPVHGESKRYSGQRNPHVFPFLINRDSGGGGGGRRNIGEFMGMGARTTGMTASAATTGAGSISTGSMSTLRRAMHMSSHSSSSSSLSLNTGSEADEGGGVTSTTMDDNTNDTAAPAPAAPAAILAAIEEKAAAAVDTIAVVMGDRPSDFDVLSVYPNVLTFRIGFAVAADSPKTRALFDEAHCDVVFIGEAHGLACVHQLLQDLVHTRQLGGAKKEAITRS